MNPQSFKALLQGITSDIGSRPLDGQLQDWLNTERGATSPVYQQLKAACEVGVVEGWLAQREGGGIKYGRIFKPDDELQGFSVDVVDMNTVAGPHHTHPLGEIDLIMPMDDTATFDGHGAGWLVYGPGSAHPPTVAHGRALVLYLLPQGRIEFTR
ncbi:MAG: DUF4863 family protein [Hydrogenophaga sp.]|nr:DUF4863 family protein [Hydrogenophaga sp.]